MPGLTNEPETRSRRSCAATTVDRLRKLGWSDAIDPDGSDSWWSTRVPVRRGNSVEVLIDGASALPEFEKAIRAAQHSVHIAGWHSSPDFELTRGPGRVAAA